MGTSFNKYAADVEAGAEGAERELLDVFSEHYLDERRVLLDIPRQLAAAREARHLTQKQLAELAGVQQSEISRIECGQINPTLGTVNKLSRSLGLQLVLVDDSGHAQPA